MSDSVEARIYLLKTVCPKCGGAITLGRGVYVGYDIPDEPDVPWVSPKSGWNKKSFDQCVNRHYFNIRPYADYDEHYIYEDKLNEEIVGLEARLAALRRLLEGEV